MMTIGISLLTYLIPRHSGYVHLCSLGVFISKYSDCLAWTDGMLLFNTRPGFFIGWHIIFRFLGILS